MTTKNKEITQESEQKLVQVFNLLNQLEVRGQKNIFALGNAMTLLEQISGQINKPEKQEGEVEEKEE